MKKTTALLLVLAMLLSLAACGEKKEEKENGGYAEVKNPWLTYESLELLNEHFGCSITKPETMDVTDENFTGLDNETGKVAQYRFTANGLSYTLRFSPEVNHDISGIYSGDGTLFAGKEGNASAETADYKASRWFTADGQYCLAVEDKGSLDMDTFGGIVAGIREAAAEKID